MNEPPWEELDELIRPLVRLLYQAGIETYGSCQGYFHSERATHLPWVRVGCSRETFGPLKDRIAKVLLDVGWNGFTIEYQERFDYQKAPRTHEEWSLVLEVWSLCGQPGMEDLRTVHPATWKTPSEERDAWKSAALKAREAWEEQDAWIKDLKEIIARERVAHAERIKTEREANKQAWARLRRSIRALVPKDLPVSTRIFPDGPYSFEVVQGLDLETVLIDELDQGVVFYIRYHSMVDDTSRLGGPFEVIDTGKEGHYPYVDYEPLKCNCNCHRPETNAIFDPPIEHENCDECAKALEEEAKWIRLKEVRLKPGKSEVPPYSDTLETPPGAL